MHDPFERFERLLEDYEGNETVERVCLCGIIVVMLCITLITYLFGRQKYDEYAQPGLPREPKGKA